MGYWPLRVPQEMCVVVVVWSDVVSGEGWHYIILSRMKEYIIWMVLVCRNYLMRPKGVTLWGSTAISTFHRWINFVPHCLGSVLTAAWITLLSKVQMYLSMVKMDTEVTHLQNSLGWSSPQECSNHRSPGSRAHTTLSTGLVLREFNREMNVQ